MSQLLPWTKGNEQDADSYPEPEQHTYGTEKNESGNAQYNYVPVRQVLQSEATGEEIRSDELVKGYEYAPNEFAAIDPHEIKAADVETSDTIDLFHFVNGADVDPIYFERSYYLAPDAGAEKVYALLLEAMRREECFGIARIGMHRREHMLILRPAKDCLVAHTMFYANEVRPAPHLEVPSQFSEKEFSMAGALIKGYSGTFDPEQFKDLYQERIQKIIDAQMSSIQRGTPAAVQRPVREIPDLMESIRLSLAQIESKKSPAKTPKKQAQKTAPSAKKKPQKVRAWFGRWFCAEMTRQSSLRITSFGTKCGGTGIRTGFIESALARNRLPKLKNPFWRVQNEQHIALRRNMARKILVGTISNGGF